jgi:imidazolonepropionase-like amidohydrolase
MSTLTVKTRRYFDGERLHAGQQLNVTVRDGRILQISEGPIATATGNQNQTREIDASSLTLLPGLIDAHFHPISASFDISAVDRFHPSLRALDARQHLESALMRGFTTVRDAGGGDIGLVRATELGLIRGPRLLIAGKALSQTGGHGDMRPADAVPVCSCGYNGALSAVVDGPEQMRHAVREQLRQGASQIKLFVSGGVLSPTDPLWMNQFTDEEIRAAVDEAETRRTYVMAHAHTADAVLRCIRNGVRSIEHGTLMNRESADAVAAAGAFVVPTLAVVDALRKDADRLPAGAAEKLAMIADQNAESLGICIAAGVKLGLGTDLFGALRDRQAHEFTVRGRVQSAADIIRSATRVNAELINMAGQVGTIAPGACADIIGLDGDPLSDLRVLGEPERHLKLVIRGGEVVLNRLTENLQ